MKITLTQIKKAGACAEKVSLFKELFGRSVILTPEVIAEHGSKFDAGWFSKNLLPADKWAEYNRVTAQAWAEYERVRDTAWAEYIRVRDTASAEYSRVTDTASAEYIRVKAPALADYRVKCWTIILEIMK